MESKHVSGVATFDLDIAVLAVGLIGVLAILETHIGPVSCDINRSPGAEFHLELVSKWSSIKEHTNAFLRSIFVSILLERS